MADPSAFGYGGAPTDPRNPQANLSPNMAGYRFSPDELRVLSECNSESFFQRSLPLGTALGLGTYAAIQRGVLKPSPRFGVFPKMTLAVVVGYFVGKLSYQQACAEKLMALPGSYIGQLLRDKRDGKIGIGPQRTKTPTMFGAGPNDIYSDAGPGSSLDLDTDRPIFNDNDSFRADTQTDTPQLPSDSLQPKRPTVSYDELRRKNRGEYVDARQDPYRLDPTSVPPISRAPRPSLPSSAPTNKYGDEME